MLRCAFEQTEAERTDAGADCDFESKICALHVDATFDAFQKEVDSLSTTEGQMPNSASNPANSPALLRAIEPCKSRF